MIQHFSCVLQHLCYGFYMNSKQFEQIETALAALGKRLVVDVREAA